MSGTLTNGGPLENKDTPHEDSTQAGEQAALQPLPPQDGDAVAGDALDDEKTEKVAALSAVRDSTPLSERPAEVAATPSDNEGAASAEHSPAGDAPATSAASATSPAAQAAVPLRPPQPRRRSQGQRALLLLLLSLSIAGTLASAAYAIGYSLNAYSTYSGLRAQAQAGVQHLLDVKTILNMSGAHPAALLNASMLQRAGKDFAAAQRNFQQVGETLEHATLIATVDQDLPQFRPEIVSLRAASRIGVDVSASGQLLVGVAGELAPDVRNALASAQTHKTQAPLITPAMLSLLGATIAQLIPRVQDIQFQSRTLSPQQLPGISQHERDQLAQLLQYVPLVAGVLTQARGLLGAAGWLLGVNQPRSFLIQTMDRAELRPTGGFTGQYGVLSINNGRIAPFTLRDISLIEYVSNSPTLGQQAPPQYRSWWPFANWGLRDSNLSADFPTSAQIAIKQYKGEVGRQVDGVVLFTPFLIEHVLQIVGPLRVGGYNDTITAQNLEERLHYYQQDNAGLAKQVVQQPGDKATSSRKRFTSLLASLLIQRVRRASPSELIAIARQLTEDLKTRDLQVYVSNPQIEGLLAQHGDAGTIDSSNSHDGLYVVQANISASKASQYVRSIMHDNVTLDSQGGATHVLQLRLAYNQLGPVYGYDTYHDYVRVYVPPSSKYLWGGGFDTGTPLCGATLVACPQRDVYPQEELQCPAGQYQPGAQAPSIVNEDGVVWHPLDSVGPPTNLVSDQPGRAMFGGWVIVPKNCSMTVTLSWYVPGQHTGRPYMLQVQRQAGTFPELDLTILPSPGACSALHSAGEHFDGVLLGDSAFSLEALPAQQRANCYPQPAV
jgi:Protein of unknown function (DUF4012)